MLDMATLANRRPSRIQLLRQRGGGEYPKGVSDEGIAGDPQYQAGRIGGCAELNHDERQREYDSGKRQNAGCDGGVNRNGRSYGDRCGESVENPGFGAGKPRPITTALTS